MSDEADAHMLDLGISALADGGFELEQSAGSLEEPARISLHPIQVRLLGEMAGLMTPDPTARMTARHIGRLHALCDRLADIRSLYLDTIIDRCADGIEFALHLRALEDLADEMLADVGEVDGDGNASAETLQAGQCHAVTAANSVTKPGPKRSGNALTPAERQRAHRAKQAEPAATQPDLLQRANL